MMTFSGSPTGNAFRTKVNDAIEDAEE